MRPTLQMRSFRLPLRAPLRSAHGLTTAVQGLLVRIEDGQGGFGLGEVSPLPDFGTESLEAATRALAAVRLDRLPESVEDLSSPEVFGTLSGTLSGAPATRAGVEMALLDLLARRTGVALARLLGVRTVQPVRVNALLRADAPGGLAVEARQAVAAGFRTLKLKVGAGAAEVDAARLHAVRDAVGPAVRLRIDANGAWTEPEARLRLALMVGAGLEYVEQPVPAADVPALRRLRSVVTVAADEALGAEGAAEALLDGADGPAADVLILKLPVLGGLLPALRLAGRARARGVDAVVTSAMDGALGRAAGASLALALGGERAHGLATGALLVEDPGAHPVLGGALVVPDRPGLGVAPEVLGW